MVTPDKVIFDEPIWQVAVKSKQNGFTLRARHTDLLYTEEVCVIEVAKNPDSRDKWELSNAVVQFTKNSCSIMCLKAGLVKPS
jgi:F0F1-type ATP synthase epsilon subunit